MRRGEAVVCWAILLAVILLVIGIFAAFGAARYEDGWRDGYRAAIEKMVMDVDSTSSAAQSAAPSPQGEGFTLIPLTQEQAELLLEPETLLRNDTSSAAQSAAPSTQGEGFDGDDIERLAVVIYQEAGSDWISDETRRMVADVVLNRVADERFEDTIEGVLLEKWQYGMLWQTGIVWPESAQYECNAHAVERAYRIAEEVLSGQHSEIYGAGYVFQAEFEQGRSGFWQDGIYFGR